MSLASVIVGVPAAVALEAGGALGGVTGRGGPLALLALGRHDGPGLRLLLVPVLLGGASVRTVALLATGGVPASIAVVALLAVPVVLVAARGGARLAGRLPAPALEAGIGVLVTLAGLRTLLA